MKNEFKKLSDSFLIKIILVFIWNDKLIVICLCRKKLLSHLIQIRFLIELYTINNIANINMKNHKNWSNFYSNIRVNTSNYSQKFLLKLYFTIF